MQKDFHYYCIAVLTRAAGFNEKDALTIAYASQYVDDSSESEPIVIGQPNPQEIKFDPVRTQYAGLKSYDWSVQKRVYMPFHFVPPQPFAPPGYAFTFVTEPNSGFAGGIFDDACGEKDAKLRLCRIGIALHTLADTWSHQGFSGRFHPENRVTQIRRLKESAIGRIIRNILLGFPPYIGHAEAGILPDQAFLKWTYKKKLTGKTVERNNTKEFMEAARITYGLLLKAKKTKPVKPTPWKDIEKKIRGLFEDEEGNLDKLCAKWEGSFNEVFTSREWHYDRQTWRDEALASDTIRGTDWDDLNQKEFSRLRFRMKADFFTSSWYLFHKAALLQRNLVLVGLP